MADSMSVKQESKTELTAEAMTGEKRPPKRAPELSAQGVFERIEDKFFIPRARLAELEMQLQERMRPSYLDPQTTYCGIESTYLDSSELLSYANHFQSVPPSGSHQRFKLRVRRYFPNDKPDPLQSALLELKSKVHENGVSKTKKLRFSLGGRDLARLMKGKPVRYVPRLVRLNPAIPAHQLLLRVRKINGLIKKFEMKPVCSVSYVRKAFEVDGLRVTFDDSISYRAIVRDTKTAECARQMPPEKQELAANMARSFRESDGVVLEIKHDGTFPDWLKTLIDQTGGREMSFSKYCFSMTEEFFASKGGSK